MKVESLTGGGPPGEGRAGARPLGGTGGLETGEEAHGLRLLPKGRETLYPAELLL